MTTPHPHAEFLHLVLNGEDTSDWEARHKECPNTTFSPASDYAGCVLGSPGFWTVRRKPKTIKIGEMDVPEPMRVAPADGTSYWVVRVAEDTPYLSIWTSDETDFGFGWLNSGLCHLKKEDAEQHRRALILASGGTP
jgi:hypothetical protein